MKEDQNSNHGQATALVGGQNSPWKAKTVWVAVLLVVIGSCLWIKDTIQKPVPADATAAPGTTSLTESGGGSAQAKPSGLKPTSPAIFRFGVSYLGGFFLGWAFRRFLKLTLLLSGAAILLIGLGQKLGWFELDWALIEGHVRSSLAWLQGEGSAIKQFVTGYLPSAGAAATGVFLGFRRK